jgi:hypothetical protein
VNSALREQIQSACNDVYRDPDDVGAIDRLRGLLGAETGVSQAIWRRLVKLACDKLYDSPEDEDSRDLLLALLTARGSTTR